MTDAAGDHFHVEWLDAGREPQCPADPRYPEGIDIDDPWDILNEPRRSPPPKVPEREKEDWSRSLGRDYSRGRERQGPGF